MAMILFIILVITVLQYGHLKRKNSQLKTKLSTKEDVDETPLIDIPDVEDVDSWKLKDWCNISFQGKLIRLEELVSDGTPGSKFVKKQINSSGLVIRDLGIVSAGSFNEACIEAFT